MTDWQRKIMALDTDARRRLAQQLGGSKPQLIAFVEGETDADLKAWLSDKVPRHKLPDSVVTVLEMPRLPNGKIDRHGLLQHLPSPSRDKSTDTFDQGNLSDFEQTLCTIWQELLGMDRIEPDDDFFELGGDSLLVIRMVSMARQDGIAIKPADIADHPTVRALAQLSDSADSIGSSPKGATKAPFLPTQAWFLGLDHPKPAHWNMAVRLHLRDNISPAVLQKALDVLLKHHPALGLRIHGDHQSAGGSLALGPQEFSLKGSLFAADLQDNILVLSAHHLLIDAVSWGILLADLNQVLEALTNGQEPPTLPPSVSPLDWALELASYATSDDARTDVAPWTQMPTATPPRATGTEAQAGRIEAILDAATTAVLLGGSAKAAFNAEPRDLMIWALAEAIAEGSGETNQRIDLEGHGRQPHFSRSDLSRTIGWLTDFYPVHITLIGEGLARGKAAKDALRIVTKNAGSFGAVRYLGQNADLSKTLAACQQTEVLFNYLGRGATSEYTHFTTTEQHDPDLRAQENLRSHLFEFNLTLRDDALHIVLTAGRIDEMRSEAQDLVARFVSQLTRVSDLCTKTEEAGFTPSDFPEAEMSQDELDAFLEGL